MRTWRAYKDAGRPYPKLSADDVVDYLIIEALSLKANREERDAERQQQIAAWKKDNSALKERAGVT